MTKRQLIPDSTVKKMETALREFGYPVDFTYCRESVDKLMAGNKAVGGPQGFMRIWLEDAELLS
ncbi:hypothetical protein LCGC14_2371430 [marine sediment metagenome]|uniref:Uncharacterized protein n=1 Tax=marine sediment metagenome TaxID=412755 RepID=A0A0F9EYC9_9ZZZZ